MTSGYVYVLLNASMPGLLKVGKTSRSACDRVAELSSASGIPTPFLLAFECEFSDCDAAERFVHAALAAKGFRVAPNREFFTAPLDAVVDSILKAREHDRQIGAAGPNAASNDAETSGRPACEYLLADGEAAYYGVGDEVQDFFEAGTFFRQAANLGCARAYRYLGAMARDGHARGECVTEAIAYFKLGAKAGDVQCWAELACAYFKQQHPANVAKCWAKYFDGVSAADPVLRPHTILTYVGQCILSDTGVDFVERFEPYRSELFMALTYSMKRSNGLEQKIFFERLTERLRQLVPLKRKAGRSVAVQIAINRAAWNANPAAISQIGGGCPSPPFSTKDLLAHLDREPRSTPSKEVKRDEKREAYWKEYRKKYGQRYDGPKGKE